MSLFELIIVISLVSALIDLARARHPRPRPSPVVVPAVDRRRFSWRVEDSLAGTLLLDVEVGIRTDVCADARPRLLDDRPGKVYHCSDTECLDVAVVEVLDEAAGSRSDEVTDIAKYLRGTADEKLLSNYQLANLVLSFVHEQCIPYSYDRDSTGHDDYFRFPLETIADATGDCDCKAILACALYEALGFEVAVAMMPGHAALAITSDVDLPFGNWSHNGKLWYYCEATGDDWVPGAIPSGIARDRIELREIRG